MFFGFRMSTATSVIAIELLKQSYGHKFVVQELPNFLTSDLLTLNNTLSISHCPRPDRSGRVFLNCTNVH